MNDRSQSAESQNGDAIEPNRIIFDAEQSNNISRITDRFSNLECIDCARAIQNYAVENGILGTKIKLKTPKGEGNDLIVDDSISSDEAISENGKHEGVEFINSNGEKVVFDNNHRIPVPTEQWIDNLFFRGMIYGQEFEINREDF